MSLMMRSMKLSIGQPNGTKELLIIAQDSTSYGWDLRDKVYLSDLINQLNKIKNIDWIRIHYAHPAHLSDKIIESMANAEKVCNYLDMPVQHASDNMLNKMRRGLGNKGIVKKINSYSHTEHNIPLYNDSNYIKDCIDKGKNFLDADDILKVETDLEKLPKYIKNNIKKFDEWIIKK